jgi:hypothetical protein
VAVTEGIAIFRNYPAQFRKFVEKFLICRQGSVPLSKVTNTVYQMCLFIERGGSQDGSSEVRKNGKTGGTAKNKILKNSED